MLTLSTMENLIVECNHQVCSYQTNKYTYVEPKIREHLYFLGSKSISGVTSACKNTCKIHFGHTDAWRSP